MVLAMFEHEDTIGLEHFFLKYQIRYLGQFLEGVWRIGKDEVKLLLARLDITEHVTTEGNAGFGVQLLQTLLNKAMVVSVHLNADDLAASSTDHFKRDTTRT